MTCRDFTDFIMSYFEGELDAAQQAAFDRHMSRCLNCMEYLAQYRQTIAAGRAAFEPDAAELPDEVPEGLIAAILATRRI